LAPVCSSDHASPILIGLFLVQRQRDRLHRGGSAAPIMLGWFIVIGNPGACAASCWRPGILAAFNPFLRSQLSHPSASAGRSCGSRRKHSLAVTGGVKRCMPIWDTFGRGPIRFGLVWRRAAGTFFSTISGQGALLLADPQGGWENPFLTGLPPTGFSLRPCPPFATLATVIASQAIIFRRILVDPAGRSSSASSPAPPVLHTAGPPARTGLCAPRELDIGDCNARRGSWRFGSSDNLAGRLRNSRIASHGDHKLSWAAACGDPVGLQPRSRHCRERLLPACSIFVFFAANSMKLFQGGWFSAAHRKPTIAFLMLTLAARSADLRKKARSSLRESEKEFVCQPARTAASPPSRAPRAFLTSGTVGIPLTLTPSSQAYLRPARTRFSLSRWRTSEEPRVPEDERAKIQDLPRGYHPGDFCITASWTVLLFRRACRLAHEQAQLSCWKFVEKSRTT